MSKKLFMIFMTLRLMILIKKNNSEPSFFLFLIFQLFNLVSFLRSFIKFLLNRMLIVPLVTFLLISLEFSLPLNISCFFVFFTQTLYKLDVLKMK